MARAARRLVTLALLAAALPGAAQAAPAGGALALHTANPNLVSSRVEATGPVPLTRACYDGRVQMPSGATPVAGGGGAWNDAAHLALFHLRGYTGTLPNGADLSLDAPVSARVANDDDRCVLLTWPVAVAGVAQHVDEWTITEADAGAVQDPYFRDGEPGSAALDGTSIVARAGAITGPNLIAASADAQVNRITYTFDRTLGAGPAPAGFVLYTRDGTLVAGVIAVAAGRTVTVQFADASAGGASVADAVRVAVLPGAVVTATGGQLPVANSLDVRNLDGAAPVNLPNLVSAAPVPGLAGVYRIRYDRNVALPLGGLAPSLFAVTENGTAIPATIVGRPDGDPAQLLLRFGVLNAVTDTKVVRIVDLGFSVFSFDAALPSALGAVAVRTPHQAAGFTEGPDLTAFSVDTGLNTATYTFDQPVAPTGAGALFNALRVGIAGPGNVWPVGPDTVPAGLAVPALGGLLGQPSSDRITVQFGHEQVVSALGGVVLDGTTAPLGAVGDVTATAGGVLTPIANIAQEAALPAAQAAAAPAGDAVPAPSQSATQSASAVRPPAPAAAAARQPAATTRGASSAHTVSGRLYRQAKGWPSEAVRVRGAPGRVSIVVFVYDAHRRLLRQVRRRVTVGERIVIHGLPRATRASWVAVL